MEWLKTARDVQVTPEGDWKHWATIAGRGYGKALSIDISVPTTTGWTTMGDIKVGDKIFDEKGAQCLVKFISEIKNDRPCYEITFSDGTKIIADEEHEWVTQCRKSRQSVDVSGIPTIPSKKRTTKDILDTLLVKKGYLIKEMNHSVEKIVNLKNELEVKKEIVYFFDIVKIDSVPVRCIQVNSPSSLFLVSESFIPTHNTRLAVEDMWWYAWENPNSRLAAVCATASDTRNTAFEGESGFMNTMPHEIIEKDGYKKQSLQIHLINGSIIQGYTADEPNRLRGPSFHRVWCDEVSSWRYEEAFDMILFCLRLGVNPQIISTSTPKPVKLIVDIIKNRKKNVILSTGSTFDNAANLAETFLSSLKEKYEGTRMGRQELYAELLDDIEGALWNMSMIHIKPATQDMDRIVVAVDPAITKNKDSDETGIVVIGAVNKENKYYVLDDLSGQYSPNEWSRKAVWAFDKYDADCIVAEKNQGGDMVSTVLRMERPNLNVKLVHATKGKYVRAEPVAALYEQKKVFHVNDFKLLVDQLITYTPEKADSSPDRMDALVWGLTDLALNKKSIVYAFA